MKTKEILRWLSVLPCALLGSIFTAVLVAFMCLIGDIFDGSFWLYIKHPEFFYYEHFFTPFITTAVLSGTFVYFGGSVAPNFKRQIAFALSIVVIILLGVFAVFAVLSHEWKILFQSIIGIVVAAVVAYGWPSDRAITC